jgi:hypothetical protein
MMGTMRSSLVFLELVFEEVFPMWSESEEEQPFLQQRGVVVVWVQLVWQRSLEYMRRLVVGFVAHIWLVL